MGLRPDFDKCATGYVWLDWLTTPYWRWRDKRAEKKFMDTIDRHFGPENNPFRRKS